LGALLDAVPEERTVQVRYPQMKQRYVYGLGAPTSSAPMSLSEAYDGGDKSRIGFHNDCYLASATDFGTFNDYGPPSSSGDTTNLKPYKELDAQFVPVGGETCGANGPDDDCAVSGGRADSEMRRLNYSFLNSEYNNPDVNNDWTGFCMEDIKKELGYRFSLISGSYPATASTGSSIAVSLLIENSGYTSPYNPRGAELILRNIFTGAVYYAPLETDPRFWFPGTHTVSETLCLPPTIPTGSYALLLRLPDPEPTIFDDPNYAIQLANNNVWEAGTGFNNLNHIIQITNAGAVATCFGNQLFTGTSVYDPAYCQLFLTVNNNIPNDVYGAGIKLDSDGKVSNNNAVIFRAGSEIELKAGFEVEPDALFWGIIEDCD